ncbi:MULTISPECIES: hypothetical protein [Oleiagrimonas]|uniref:Lipoprotein n=1 Tax=Oleiagrimonas citrea TaxID=1665687 RepID=A0A846ZNP0_9GAMM|nr:MULTISPECIES: hypothetical protein [Oleiagrimonas]NKZ39139.1 hypothetical protein [Oleiagrimonas citrea]RAP57745.1 hypothetical protein BTJ49_07590 [Oleiagrimonas sp. MCCC 1A03011]
MKPIGLLMGACLLAGLTGCTVQQLYASGQSWQRNECFKLIDSVQRNQCLAQTWMPYDQYTHELHQDNVERAQLARP